MHSDDLWGEAWNYVLELSSAYATDSYESQTSVLGAMQQRFSLTKI
jgi:hypothetical protein